MTKSEIKKFLMKDTSLEMGNQDCRTLYGKEKWEGVR